MAIFAGNTQKDSLINYSKIAQFKYSIFRTMTLFIVLASDCAALRVSVMHWRLEVILYTLRLLKEVAFECIVCSVFRGTGNYTLQNILII